MTESIELKVVILNKFNNFSLTCKELFLDHLTFPIFEVLKNIFAVNVALL